MSYMRRKGRPLALMKERKRCGFFCTDRTERRALVASSGTFISGRVGQRIGFAIRPDIFDRVEFRSVGRKKGEMEARVIVP